MAKKIKKAIRFMRRKVSTIKRAVRKISQAKKMASYKYFRKDEKQNKPKSKIQMLYESLMRFKNNLERKRAAQRKYADRDGQRSFA